MVNFRKNHPAFFMAFVLSAVFHLTLLVWFAGYRGFAFPIPEQRKIIEVTLKEENNPAVDLRTVKTIALSRLVVSYDQPVRKDRRDEKYVTQIEKAPEDIQQKEGVLPQNVQHDSLDAAIEEPPSKLAGNTPSAENRDENRKESTGINSDIGRVTKASLTDGNPSQTTIYREKLYFDIYWLGIYAGRAIVESVLDSDIIRITSQVHSAPFISTFYKVEDYAESVVMNGMPASLRIKQHEGKYRSDKETIFDNINKKITFFNYLKGKKREHDTAGVVWDVLSGFYYLRSQSYDSGKDIFIDIFDSDKFYKVAVNVLKREKIELPFLGEVQAIKVKTDLKCEGLFQKIGEIFIWFTDDEKRIPVKFETKVSIGNVVIELSRLEIG